MTARTRRRIAAAFGTFALVVMILDGTRPAAAIPWLGALHDDAGVPTSTASPASSARQPTTPPTADPTGPGAVPADAPIAVPTIAPTPTPMPAPVPAPPPSRTPTPSPAPPKNVTTLPTPGPRVVYLTFDDGPSRYTPHVLALLARHDAKATFFVVGSQAAADPAGVRAIRAAGHKVANHSWSHPDLTRLSAAAIRGEISRTDAAFGAAAKCVRPPYGATNDIVAQAISSTGKRSVLWSVDSLDWTRPGADSIAGRILAQVTPGAIVLLHDGGGDRSQTVAALATVLDSLQSQGYSFRTLPSC